MKTLKCLSRLKTLGDSNRIYNFQDTAILCEVFEQRFSLLQKLFKYNTKKCNSASSFSGCVQRLKANVVSLYQQMQKLLEFLNKQ